MSEMTERQLLRPGEDGIPTGPEVNLLLQAYPNLRPGDVVEYTAISAIVREVYGTRRFETIVRAWMRALLATNVVVHRPPGRGVRVQFDSEVSNDTQSVLSHAAAKVRRQRAKLEVLNPEDDDTRRQIMHGRMTCVAAERDIKARRREALAPVPHVPQVPPRPLPKKDSSSA